MCGLNIEEAAVLIEPSCKARAGERGFEGGKFSTRADVKDCRGVAGGDVTGIDIEAGFALCEKVADYFALGGCEGEIEVVAERFAVGGILRNYGDFGVFGGGGFCEVRGELIRLLRPVKIDAGGVFAEQDGGRVFNQEVEKAAVDVRKQFVAGQNFGVEADAEKADVFAREFFYRSEGRVCARRIVLDGNGDFDFRRRVEFFGGKGCAVGGVAGGRGG